MNILNLTPNEYARIAACIGAIIAGSEFVGVTEEEGVYSAISIFISTVIIHAFSGYIMWLIIKSYNLIYEKYNVFRSLKRMGEPEVTI